MSTNLSKEKRDNIIIKIKEIRDFISSSPQDKNTGNLLTYLSEIEKEISAQNEYVFTLAPVADKHLFTVAKAPFLKEKWRNYQN